MLLKWTRRRFNFLTHLFIFFILKRVQGESVMAVHTVEIPWGSKVLPVTLPDEWEIIGTLEPSPRTALADATAETEHALSEPIGAMRLSAMVKPGMRIALVIDDGSRPTPVAKLLPAVLGELQRGGASLDQILVVPALGVHRMMTDDEVTQRLGGEWASQLKWEHHDCDDPNRLADLGLTSRGTPVLINRSVAEADLVVSIGCIEPHIIASFGGGYKNIIPGVAGRATIAHNHGLNCTPSTFNMVGQPIEQNPMRLDLEEGAARLKAPVFIINAVLNSNLQPVAVVAGDPIAAHRAGARISASIYGVQVPGMADVLITGSHPMDQDLRQGVKALANMVRGVRPGGVMLTLVRADEGVGVFGLANRKLPVGRRALKLLAPLLLPRVPKLKLKGMGEEDKFFLYFALQGMLRADLLLYAPTIPEQIHENLPFVTFMPDVQAGITRARQRFPKKARVLVAPHGGMTYPILPE
jgi:nickel-dependent lactate racemase